MKGLFRGTKQAAIELLRLSSARERIKSNRFLIQLSIQALREELHSMSLLVTFLTRVALRESQLLPRGHTRRTYVLVV